MDFASDAPSDFFIIGHSDLVLHEALTLHVSGLVLHVSAFKPLQQAESFFIMGQALALVSFAAGLLTAELPAKENAKAAKTAIMVTNVFFIYSPNGYLIG